IQGLVLIIHPAELSVTRLLQDEAEWMYFFRKHFIGPLDVLKSTLPFLEENGKIEIIAGMSSTPISPEYGLSCLLHSMWDTHAQALSLELKSRGISVKCLEPNWLPNRSDHRAKQ